LKLLRSAVDGQVFDCIAVVKERYAVAPGTRKFASEVEIFQTSRPVYEVRAGMRLRVVDTVQFRVLYSMDRWATSTTLQSRPVGYAGSFADIPTVEGQSGSIVFTFYWPAQDRWLGRNFEVGVTAE
jgi:glucoamylase